MKSISVTPQQYDKIFSRLLKEFLATDKTKKTTFSDFLANMGCVQSFDPSGRMTTNVEFKFANEEQLLIFHLKYL